MTTLHMKTEEVRNAAHQLDLAVEDLYLKPYKLKSAAGSLRSAWQGGKSAYYANQLQQMGNTLREEVMDLQRLVKRLYIEVDQWEDADKFEKGPALSSIISQGGGALLSPSVMDNEKRVIMTDLSKEINNAHMLREGFRWGISMPTSVITSIYPPPAPVGVAISIGMGIVGGALEFHEKSLQDFQKYSDPYDLSAALLIDAVFVSVKTAIKTGSKIAAGMLFKTSLVTALTGVGLPTALAAGAAGLLLWAGGELLGKGMDWGYDLFKESAVKGLSNLLRQGSEAIDNAFNHIRGQVCAIPP